MTDIANTVADVFLNTGLDASNFVKFPLLTPAEIFFVILDDRADVSVPDDTGT